MIAPMDRLEIVFLRSELPALLPFLQEQGLLHIEEVPLELEAAPEYLHRVQLAPEQQTRLDTLEELERLFLEIVPLLAANPTPSAVAKRVEDLGELDLEPWAQRVRTWNSELRAMTRQRVDILDNIEVLQHYAQSLRQIEPVLSAHGVMLGKGARAFILKGDVTQANAQLAERVEALGVDCKLVTQQPQRHLLVGAVMFPESEDDAITRLFQEFGITHIETPHQDFHGAPAKEVLERVERTIASNRNELEALAERLRDYAAREGADLLAMQAVVGDHLRELRALGNLAQSEMIAVVQGWVPSETTANLKAEIDRRFAGQTLVSTLPVDHDEYQRIPTLLRNHKLFQPFEILLKVFQPPTYGTVDPTPVVAVFFILFYGFILGDVGYAFFVLGLAWWLRKKFAANAIVHAAGTVGLWMGASAFVFGVLFGEYFGDAGTRIVAAIQGKDMADVHLYLWFHRVHDTQRLLLYGLLFGIVHIPLSLIIGVREDLRHHHKKHAMEKLGLLLGLCGVGIIAMRNLEVAPFTAPGFTYLMAALFMACFGLLIYGFGALALVQVMEVVSLFGNVLSYARLMALGIASAALADVANQMATQAPNLALGICIALPIHLLNIGIGMFSPTIHSLRLNYVEFLPKFYAPEGHEYEPFRKEATW